MFRIVREPIDVRALDTLTQHGDGGVVSFLGIVRETADDGRPVHGIYYEAFEPMAVREFETIAAEARDRYGEVALAIVHRIGELRIGEVAVAVLAAAPHRAEAFDACRYAIDQLKERAPIWKQERYADGERQWKPGRG